MAHGCAEVGRQLEKCTDAQSDAGGKLSGGAHGHSGGGAAGTGTVRNIYGTIGAVVVRRLRGYCWQPDAAEEVLVVKGNELYVPGKLQKSPRALAPGEVLIYAGSSEIFVSRTGVEITGKVQIAGDVRITGDLYVNGTKMEVP